MRCPVTLPNESERLSALSDYGFDDESLLSGLDPVVRIAVRMFAKPMPSLQFEQLYGIGTRRVGSA